MKLRKILSGVIAAAVAASTVIMTPILADAASAEEDTTVETTIVENMISESSTVDGVAWGSVYVQASENDYSWTWAELLADEDVLIKVNYTLDDTGAASHNNGMVNGGLEGGWYSGDIKAYNGSNVVYMYVDIDAPVAGTAYDAYAELSGLNLSAESTDEWGQLGFNFQANVSNASYTINSVSLVKFETTTDSTEDPEETEDTDEVETSDYALLYDGEFEVTTNYEGNQISVTAVEGDKITVTYELNDADTYHQLSFKHGADGWPALTSPEYTNEWNCVDVSTDGTFTFTLNAEDAANITANKLIVSGYSVTYTKVELNADKKPADEEEEEAEETSEYDTRKVELVSDYSGSGELYVMSITGSDANSHSKYTVTVTVTYTDDTPNRTITKDVSTCYRSFTYPTTSGSKTGISNDGNYFIIIKVINIPENATIAVSIDPAD